MKTLFDIIKRPVVTEKSSLQGENGKYSFVVSKDATKENVAKAVEKIFTVKVKKVNIIILPGKTKRFKGVLGKRQDLKKAIVTLEENNMIDYSGGIN
ncbi:MAG: 50S ribosomal protein L23 [Rickettsiaceae bacterium]|nr:50S ribosomal protein L23 [Rickettsiaceae bacterium]